ncbi:type I DNA topoisomerase [Candidatus Pantoea edessiphila]|uniref:DNA topoisomerase 1 n=1 Tax=Candidatus Pantoea edessiphila TaxID=2044610 RepID=A0A2P5SYP3_9GAMM|nr:type I DNA topoisomerase [Candidatus Pantoea edessiphila]MBK4775411.1 type I DNA topoisomerase [Pantoea sp. Edef]PPI87459.1 type I DNA topoisomerase [Candidatus Pantoea edessiphila]
MSKILVIVESPAKAKTINQYLDKNYIVKSSVGHIRDLPKSNHSISKKHKIISNDEKTNHIHKKDKKLSLIKRMGIDPYNNWKANYQVIPGKEKIVAELKILAKQVDHIYLATDLDREGEAIAWHLQKIIGGNNDRFSRIIFNEITEKKILKAFKHPVKLNINKVNAQQTRRFMDRIVGYMVSPLLWKKIARGLSAGRVQSVAVRLIAEREQKIKAFIPKEYWKLQANFNTAKNEEFQMEITHFNKEILNFSNENDVLQHIKLLKQLTYKITNSETKIINIKPPAPYITSTLQQAANIALGFSVKKTMMIAQRLYEAGYITYMRTDSTNISQEALKNVRNYIIKKFGNQYIPKFPIIYNKQNSQEAHEAIRPSNVILSSESLKGAMELDARKLYELIWSQFLACQMPEAKYELTILTAKAGEYQLKSSGKILKFDGWHKILPNKRYKNHRLFDVNIGDNIYLKNLNPSQHFTKPLSRFTEALLVKELEKMGIGRPSTYSSIISTIQERGYIRIENHRFYIEKIGEIVTDCLKSNFSELMSYNFTAHMENNLDKIANNQAEWKQVLNIFFDNFIKQLIEAEKQPKEGGMQLNKMVLVSLNCSICNRRMGIRNGSTGVFLGCSGYALKAKDRCKKTINLIMENEINNVFLNNQYNNNINYIITNKHCQKCNTIMDNYITIDSKYKFYICGNNPRCDGYEIEKGQFYIQENNYSNVNCDKCHIKMEFKIGRFGKYLRCINCNNARKILKDGNVAAPTENPVPFPELLCEKSHDYFVLRNSSAGIFFSASTFPKLRETRSPLVEELKRFRDRLPNNLLYLTEAPSTDPEGNKTIIKYSRNKKQQYIVSIKKGKKTNWIAFYTNGKWQETKN